MRILAVDTSGPSLSVALTVQGVLVYESTLQNGRTHSENLMTMIDAALSMGGVAPKQVDCFACVNGPGSFTGVRIGVSAVKAFSFATGRPCVGVGALEALSLAVPLFEGVVCALQDARADQVYAAAFVRGGRVLPDRAIALDDFLRRLPPEGPCCFVGDGALRHRGRIEQALPGRALFAPTAFMAIRASLVASLAEKQAERWGDAAALAPYYLRAPQAERERAAREARNG